MYAVFGDLSDLIKKTVDGLSSLHSSEQSYKVHYNDRGQNDNEIYFPQDIFLITRAVPVTVKKALLVNPTFGTGVVGLSECESEAVLELMFQNAESTNYQSCFRWSLNDTIF